MHGAGTAAAAQEKKYRVKKSNMKQENQQNNNRKNLRTNAVETHEFINIKILLMLLFFFRRFCFLLLCDEGEIFGYALKFQCTRFIHHIQRTYISVYDWGVCLKSPLAQFTIGGGGRRGWGRGGTFRWEHMRNSMQLKICSGHWIGTILKRNYMNTLSAHIVLHCIHTPSKHTHI